MEKVTQRFSTHAASDQADRAYYLSLTPAQRLDILLDLMARYRDAWGEASNQFKRVYRIRRLGET
jgi:hypothetical protein